MLTRRPRLPAPIPRGAVLGSSAFAIVHRVSSFCRGDEGPKDSDPVPADAHAGPSTRVSPEASSLVIRCLFRPLASVGAVPGCLTSPTSPQRISHVLQNLPRTAQPLERSRRATAPRRTVSGRFRNPGGRYQCTDRYPCSGHARSTAIPHPFSAPRSKRSAVPLFDTLCLRDSSFSSPLGTRRPPRDTPRIASPSLLALLSRLDPRTGRLRDLLLRRLPPPCANDGPDRLFAIAPPLGSRELDPRSRSE